MIKLVVIKRTDPILLKHMEDHYSKPKGFVGRNICYAIYYNDIRYGSIVGGSATLHLPGRNSFFNIDKSYLNKIVNNIFYHVEKIDGKYPVRNFTSKILKLFRDQIKQDWLIKYQDEIIGYESLVELPRTGECYRRDGWCLISQTKGYTCKRSSGQSTDSWTGRRIWNTKELRPKLVFCRKI